MSTRINRPLALVTGASRGVGYELARQFGEHGFDVVIVEPKDDPADVAEDAFDALMAGKDHVVAGSLNNRIQAAVAQVTPEPLKAKLHRRMAEPGSGKEAEKK